MSLDLAGDRGTLVYQKPDFTPATYTILNFPVDDIDQAVDELAARGVSFERYDGFEQDEKGIARGDGADDRLVQGSGRQRAVRASRSLGRLPRPAPHRRPPRRWPAAAPPRAGRAARPPPRSPRRRRRRRRAPALTPTPR